MSLGEALRRPLYRIYEDRLLRSLDRSRLPRHIGVIHDGHRRFARAAGLPDYATSYRAGMDKVVEFLGWCRDLEVPAVTCWLLSKENLSRPAAELEPYFEVLAGLFDRLPEEPGAAGRAHPGDRQRGPAASFPAGGGGAARGPRGGRASAA